MRQLIYKYLLFFRKKDIQTKPSNVHKRGQSSSFYDIKFNSIDGKEIDFSVYKNKKVLIVNTASECGYTPQYNDLQELHQKYGNKIVILGFPSNDFGGQEPNNNEEIKQFCETTFEITFQLFEKSKVRGARQNPLYRWLTTKEQNGWNTQPPDWNFCKYLVSENGELLKFYSSSVNPMSDDVLKML